MSVDERITEETEGVYRDESSLDVRERGRRSVVGVDSCGSSMEDVSLRSSRTVWERPAVSCSTPSNSSESVPDHSRVVRWGAHRRLLFRRGSSIEMGSTELSIEMAEAMERRGWESRRAERGGTELQIDMESWSRLATETREERRSNKRRDLSFGKVEWEVGWRRL